MRNIMPPNFTYSYFRMQETAVSEITRDKCRGFFEVIELAVNALIAALNEITGIPDVNTVSGTFQSLAWFWYLKVIYTIGATTNCFEHGYYNESLVLTRSISEHLVQVLYLCRHPEQVRDLPNLQNDRRRKISFKKMFDEIAPGYYDKHYWLNSEFAHPGLTCAGLKLNIDFDGTSFLDQGVVFKEDGVTRCFNGLLILMIGLLRSIDLVFPKANFTESTVQLLIDAEARLKWGIESHIEFKGGPNDWHTLSKPLWMPYDGDLATRLKKCNSTT